MSFSHSPDTKGELWKKQFSLKFVGPQWIMVYIDVKNIYDQIYDEYEQTTEFIYYDAGTLLQSLAKFGWYMLERGITLTFIELF